MAIVGYFIDRKWKLREVLLGFEPLSGQHTGKKLAIVVNAVLDNYRLSDRVFALVTDNASNNGTLASEPADMLLYFNKDEMHLSCLAHVIQLAIRAIFNSIGAGALIDDEIEIWNEQECFVDVQHAPGLKRTLEKVR